MTLADRILKTKAILKEMAFSRWREYLPDLGVLFALLSSFVGSSIAFADTRFLTISDIHYGSKCSSKEGADTGKDLFAISMAKFRDLSKDVDFLINLGDLPAHLGGPNPARQVYEKTVFKGLAQANVYKKPFFYVSGNNDSLGGNYQPFEVDGKSPLDYAPGWQGACMYCKGLLIDDKYMRSKGYYLTYVRPGNKNILLLVLNGTQWLRYGFFSLTQYPNQHHDAEAQLHWMAKQLRKHRAKQLLIALHEPPGNSYIGTPFWNPEYLSQFEGILAKYQSHFQQITLLTSHTHMDEIRKMPLPNGQSIYAFSVPSVSRVHYNNASMKIFTLDNQLRLKDFTTYYTTSNKLWGSNNYKALGGTTPVFPHCTQKTLSQCLDSITDKQVCDYIEASLMYGVKSAEVNNKACGLTYTIP